MPGLCHRSTTSGDSGIRASSATGRNPVDTSTNTPRGSSQHERPEWNSIAFPARLGVIKELASIMPPGNRSGMVLPQKSRLLTSFGESVKVLLPINTIRYPSVAVWIVAVQVMEITRTAIKRMITRKLPD